MNTRDAFAGSAGPFVNVTNTLPCPICGETVVLAYPGLHPNWATVVCIEQKHFQGWTPWPDCGKERYDA